MRTRTAGALTLLLAAGALGTLTGTATAAPPAGSGTENTTTGSASAFPLVGGAGVFLSAYDPDGEAPFTVPEVLAGAYECFADERLPADFRGLGSVRTAGTTGVTCSADGLPDVTGTLGLDVEWRGRGPATEQPEPPVPTGCDLRVLIRQADLTGSITLEVPALGIDATADLAGVRGDIRTALSNCAAPH
ncbi:hypothetical protein GCM10027451_28550 [Geodermatophilus aquaeductus]|uniref:PknH-like extracellular domain-containing protein n=1 Tax=Geodermatophilus aquaeductus TaxID=1564161 RepID=A0A521F6P5_9ACTN|nr:hypothetical protein [Geodermatophilus aquaeductus]SMO91875.1 hypothetical protein SAMN06273567_107108 [Geodermatophilus aquaeductus]